MNSYGFLAAGAALLMGTAGAAANGNGGYDAPVPPPDRSFERSTDEYDWSGIYVGVQGGWRWGEDEANEIFVQSGELLDDTPFYDIDGYSAGGMVGVNLQTGHWVYGVELGAEYVDADGRWVWPTGNILTKEVDISGSLRARAGFALDRILIYATAGLAVVHAHMAAIDVTPPEDGPARISGADTGFGYTYGGGAEVGFWGNWSAGVEYRYSDAGSTEISGNIFNDEFRYSHTNEFHAVRARLTYRFPI